MEGDDKVGLAIWISTSIKLMALRLAHFGTVKTFFYSTAISTVIFYLAVN